ncbi:MAG: glycosyltransferase family 2 protein [Candidatus Omnitrophota bacterium]|nr:MAG: glycosyltransferase family 2 protein [Candidatus Omnitrophota bacterium]
MKLIVQIPCWNEEEVLAQTIEDIPRRIPGVAKVEILIIDDGSTDGTIKVAERCGVEHIVRLRGHKGLAKAFAIGIETALRLGADIIVNTDADNQYKGEDIVNLIQPILEKRADVVIGVRDIHKQKEFGWIKKKMQKIGSWVVRRLSGTDIQDVTSGFRAYTAEAATKINVISEYSYTLETIIQGERVGLVFAQVPVRTNAKRRESRLFKNIWYYILRSIATIAKVYTIYRPLRVFFSSGFAMFFLGFLIGLRYLYFFLMGNGKGHVQSLILSSILIILGFQMFVVGLLANIISANRFLIENILRKVRKMELKGLKAEREQ